jgi:hypothetical protein
MRSFGWSVLLLAMVGAVAKPWPTAFAHRATRPDKTLLSYRHDAAGQHATWDDQWRISPGTAGSLGLITGVAVCGDQAFLLDRHSGTVHRADLSLETIVGRIGGTSGADRLATPSGLAADCDRALLYVVDASGVIAFDAGSGAVRARYAKPNTFVNSIAPAIVDGDAHALYVSGLWAAARADWFAKPVGRMFEGDGIGYRLDLESGAASGLVPAVEAGCWSLGPNCLYALVDRVRGSDGAAWIAAHRVGMSVGVFDAASRLVRTIDVRSPFFLDNDEQNGSASLVDMVAWNERNSVLRGVFSFGPLVATVHSFNRTLAWQPGGHIDFDVFLNVHSLDGDRILSDVRLPDLPVGRDDTSLYVVDYRSDGRHDSGQRPITLMRIPIASNIARFQ